MVVNGDRIKVLAQRDPAELPWGALGVDVVLECTGFFTTKEKASAHLKGGAKKVIISAPGGKDVDATIVYGVNHDTLKASHTVISNASCTTNCLAPLVKPLHDKIGVVNGLMTTIHAYTNDQVLTDVYHEDLRRARSATMSMIPTKTGAAAAVGLVLPELNGKLDGYAIRVPTINVSIVDLSFIAARDTTVDEVNAIMKAAAESRAARRHSQLQHGPLVSVDFNHDPASSTFDATLTKVSGRLVKVSSWYDNEWGFSNRMLDTTMCDDGCAEVDPCEARTMRQSVHRASRLRRRDLSAALRVRVPLRHADARGRRRGDDPLGVSVPVRDDGEPHQRSAGRDARGLARAHRAARRCGDDATARLRHLGATDAAFRRLADVDVVGKRVFIRSDLNVPQDDAGNITDDTRISASVPGIRDCGGRGGAIMVTSHLGRPTEGHVERSRLARARREAAVRAARASRAARPRLGRRRRVARRARARRVVLLENCRFNAGEKKDDDALARKMAQLCDVYVNDAFGTAHRAEATTHGIARMRAGRVRRSAAGGRARRARRRRSPIPRGRSSPSSAARRCRPSSPC